MVDFSKIKVNKKVNKKEKANLSIRKTEEVEKIRPPVPMKNFNISMFKQVFQWCDICAIGAVHIIKENSLSCIYCNSSYTINVHNQYKKVIPIIYVSQNAIFLI